MYTIRVEGVTRYAEFQLDEAAPTFRRTLLEITEDDDSSDCLRVGIYDVESGSELRDVWMYLHGKPWQIMREIVEVYPMAKLESEAILKYLDTVDQDEVVSIAYPAVSPSPVIRRAKMHQLMRASLKSAVASIFDQPESGIEVLNINE